MSELHSPATATLEAPASNGGTPPGTIRLHPEGKEYFPPPRMHRPFRRHFLDRQDPFEAAGWRMEQFTFSNSYDLEGVPPQQVANDIHTILAKQLSDGNLASAELQIIDFKDAAIRNEPARRFLVTRTQTARGTFVTVNAHFQQYGDHLFYSVRSYLLPKLSLSRLSLSLILSIGALRACLEVPQFLVVVLPVLVYHLRTFISDIAFGDPFLLALRKKYPGFVTPGSFDHDDVTAFLKTNVALVLKSTATVLERHGVDTGGLRNAIQHLEINNINTGGGNIIGAVFGGKGNSASGRVRT